MHPLKLQPIPYQGSKRQLAPRICKLFPSSTNTLYEPFSGSAAVSIFAATHKLARNFVIGDVLPELVDLWRLMIDQPGSTAARYRTVWDEQFKVGADHFNIVRESYNNERDPVFLLYLIARCVKNAVRFNRHGKFTQSVDKRRTGVNPDKVERAFHTVSSLFKGRTEFYCGDFRDCVSEAGSKDLVYMDPPYQGTTYGRDKRYAAGLDRERLIKGLRDLNERRVAFILSYDGTTGDKVYAEPLPEDLDTNHLQIHAGRSSQATLAGRAEDTVESLYVSKSLLRDQDNLPDYSRSAKLQAELFV